MPNAKSPSINLRTIAAKILSLESPPKRETFVFEFDGTETEKVLKKGWEPKAVFLDGSREREGTGNDYTVSFDGFVYSVVWAVAPSSTSFAQIDAEMKQ